MADGGLSALGAFDWLQILSLAGITGAVPGIILWLLNRRGANRKLDLEEGGIALDAYKHLLESVKEDLKEAKAEREAAEKALSEYRADKSKLLGIIGEQNVKIQKLKDLLQMYITRVGVPMTSAEKQVFDMITPSK